MISKNALDGVWGTLYFYALCTVHQRLGLELAEYASQIHIESEQHSISRYVCVQT